MPIPFKIVSCTFRGGSIGLFAVTYIGARARLLVCSPFGTVPCASIPVNLVLWESCVDFIDLLEWCLTSPKKIEKQPSPLFYNPPSTYTFFSSNKDLAIWWLPVGWTTCWLSFSSLGKTFAVPVYTVWRDYHPLFSNGTAFTALKVPAKSTCVRERVSEWWSASVPHMAT